MALQIKKTPVKVLTDTEQQKSIKGLQQVEKDREKQNAKKQDAKKQKKKVMKNTLQSPFSSNWPNTDTGEVIRCLEASCSSLPPKVKHPWREVQKFKKEERKQFLQALEKHIIENVDPLAGKKREEREEALSHLVFGYNAVMRAIERNQLAGILLKKNVEPEFLMKAFIPGCLKKNIPLVPIPDLDQILRSDSTLGIGHQCMVLGLKPSVKESSCRFNALYKEMSKSILMCDPSNEGEGNAEEVDGGKEDMEVNSHGNGTTLHPQYPHTKEQIETYHLKRSNKGERIFKPAPEEEEFIAVSSLPDEFQSFKMSTLVKRGNKFNSYVPAKKKRITSNPQRKMQKN